MSSHIRMIVCAHHMTLEPRAELFPEISHLGLSALHVASN